MKNYVLFLFLLCFAAALRAATPKPMPMYIVNGKETKEIRSIPPEDIEHVEMLPAAEVRMGKGKGNPEGFVAPVTPGRILFEAEGVPLEVAQEALRLGAQKLPITTKFIVRRDYVETTI